MIGTRLTKAFDALETRLTARAVDAAQSRARYLRQAARRDGSHWRDARMLWPFFTKDR